jgi:epoxyqueuosine reductase
MLSRLEALADFIRVETGNLARYRAHVDTGPVLERAYAAQAGIGFVGKNTCLIHPQLGSWLFLGVILVDVDLPRVQDPLPPRCGSCTRCIDACPTGALVAPYRLDARRCISYLTIELKGAIPSGLRSLVGDRVFGCDVCQEVCPWQRFARSVGMGPFRPASSDRVAPLLPDLLVLDEAGFRRRFEGSPLLRTGRVRLARNAAVALGNLGDSRAVPALASALRGSEPLVRAHAAWALGRISGQEAVRELQSARDQEPDLSVRQELTAALEEVAGE